MSTCAVVDIARIGALLARATLFLGFTTVSAVALVRFRPRFPCALVASASCVTSAALLSSLGLSGNLSSFDSSGSSSSGVFSTLRTLDLELPKPHDSSCAQYQRLGRTSNFGFIVDLQQQPDTVLLEGVPSEGRLSGSDKQVEMLF